MRKYRKKKEKQLAFRRRRGALKGDFISNGIAENWDGDKLEALNEEVLEEIQLRKKSRKNYSRMKVNLNPHFRIFNHNKDD